jgi:ornithine cyclodeaminase
MRPELITYEATMPRVSWAGAVEALVEGHRAARAEVADIFLGPDAGTLLSRGAYIPGLGYGVKSVTVFGANPAAGLPTVQGAMLLFEAEQGRLVATLESRLVTEVKTAADSLLGASLLARPDSRRLLIVGAGTVARSLVSAYASVFPRLARITIWARRPEQADSLATSLADLPQKVHVVSDLATACADADIISSATVAREPILNGAWISPGTHVDLIGAYKADMREADDKLIAMGSLYVDSRKTTLGHIGEIDIPIARGVISPADIRGDFYDLLTSSVTGRVSQTQVTIFKNGGGAHLDLMIARYLSNLLSTKD